MNRLAAYLLFLGLGVSLTGRPQSCMFTKVVTAGGTDSEESKSIVSDPEGNLYISGTFESICYFGNDSISCAGSENMFLAKYSPSSGFLWAIAPNSTYRVTGEAIALDDQGSLYVTGYFYGDVDFGAGFSFTSSHFNTYLAKYSPSGNLIWATAIAGDDNDPRSITCDDTGNIYLTGRFEGDLVSGTVSIYSFRTACFLVKIGSDGETQWIFQSTGSGTSYPASVSVESSGDIILTGTFINPVTFGNTNLSGFGSYDVFVCRLDPSGNVVWAIQAGGNHDDRGSSVVCGTSGTLYITGYFEDSAHFGPFNLSTGLGPYSFDTYAAKLNGDGNFVWAKSINVGCPDNNLLCSDSCDNIYLTGSFGGMAEVGPSILWSHGYGDLYVIKIDRDGQILFAKGAGSSWVEQGLGITLMPSGDLAVTGILSNEAIFDSITVTSGSEGIFIALLDQYGPLSIDEINYSSSGSMDTGDWIELHNNGDEPIELTEWTLKDGNDYNEFVLNPFTTIEPGGFFVICQDTLKFRTFHPDMVNVTGPFNFELASNGEKVRLYDADGLLIAQVRYYSAPPWPDLGDGTGRTIELRSQPGELSDGNNWFPGCPGGSPGTRYIDCDSLGVMPALTPVSLLAIYPNPASESIVVEWVSPDGSEMEFRIVDATGRRVKTIFFNAIKPGINTIETGVEDLPPGLYLAVILSGGRSGSGRFIKAGN